jgi:hypothetical protein
MYVIATWTGKPSQAFISPVQVHLRLVKVENKNWRFFAGEDKREETTILN